MKPHDFNIVLLNSSRAQRVDLKDLLVKLGYELHTGGDMLLASNHNAYYIHDSYDWSGHGSGLYGNRPTIDIPTFLTTFKLTKIRRH